MIHVGMTQACLTKDINKQREPGVFHGVRQHIAAEFENELDNYGWVLQGQSALHGPANGRNIEKGRTLSVTLFIEALCLSCIMASGACA